MNTKTQNAAHWETANIWSALLFAIQKKIWAEKEDKTSCGSPEKLREGLKCREKTPNIQGSIKPLRRVGVSYAVRKANQV